MRRGERPLPAGHHIFFQFERPPCPARPPPPHTPTAASSRGFSRQECGRRKTRTSSLSHARLSLALAERCAALSRSFSLIKLFSAHVSDAHFDLDARACVCARFCPCACAIFHYFFADNAFHSSPMQTRARRCESFSPNSEMFGRQRPLTMTHTNAIIVIKIQIHLDLRRFALLI